MAIDSRACGIFLLFAKSPRPGNVKTRLQPALDAQQAAAVARALVQQTVRALAHRPPGWSACLCADDPADAWLCELAASRGLGIAAQGEGDLGRRMGNALEGALRGYRAAIVIGSDCVGFDLHYLHAAAAALEDGKQAVLGPARDGGYVLVGLCTPPGDVFDGIGWGGSGVAESQRRRFAARGLAWHELPLREDVDRPEDLWQVCPALPRPAAQALVMGRLSP